MIDKRDRDAFSHYENENDDFRSYFTLKLQRLDKQSQKQKDQQPADGNCTREFFPYCFKNVYNTFTKKENPVHTRSIHAEEMAFLNETIDCDGGFLFTTFSPCELCAKKACHKGIEHVYYVVPCKGIANDHILKAGASKNKLSMEMFRGATGKAYAKLYTPWMSHKDEYYMKKGFQFSDELKKIKIKATSGGRDAKYLFVKEERNHPDKYSIGLSGTESASTFDIIEEDQKIVIRYTMKDTSKLDRRGWKDEPCPLCDTQAPKEAAEVCRTCGFPKSTDSEGGGTRVLGNPRELSVYVCADLNDNKGKGTLKANRMHKYTWEKFKIRFVDKKRFRLQAMANDRFVGVGSDDRLIADGENEGSSSAGCLFEIEFVDPGQA